MRMMTKRAARAAVKCPLLGVAEAHRNPPERSFAEGWFVVGGEVAQKTRDIESRRSVPWGYVGQKTNIPVSRESVPGGGDFCGGEEHRAGVGARSALRKHSHRGCPSGESEANAASSAVRPQPELSGEGYTKCDRHGMSFRRVPAPATRARSMEGDANIETVL